MNEAIIKNIKMLGFSPKDLIEPFPIKRAKGLIKKNSPGMNEARVRIINFLVRVFAVFK